MLARRLFLLALATALLLGGCCEAGHFVPFPEFRPACWQPTPPPADVSRFINPAAPDVSE